MKLLRVGLVGVITCVLFGVAPAHALDTVPYDPPAELADSPVTVTGYSLSNKQLGYIQLYNSSDTPVNITGWQLEYIVSGSTTPTLSMPLAGWIAPQNYVVVADVNVVANADFTYTQSIDGFLLPAEIRMTPPITSGIASSIVALIKEGSYQRKKSTTTGGYLSTFEVVASPILYGGGFYEFPSETLLQFSEIVPNPRECSPLEQAVECGDYIKLYNPTNQPIDLSQFRLRVGYQGQTPSASNTYMLYGIIEPGKYAVVARSSDNRPLSITNSGGFLWLEDKYGVTRYDATVLEYADASADTKKGHAWAYDVNDGLWKWTSQPTPFDGPSVFPAEVMPVAKAAAVSTLVPCKEGQYRSEETNRCRSAETASGTLTPCNENQERNPETNRCRNSATLASQLTPCKEGQERNSETNRCRNVQSSIPEAAFAVEPVVDTGKAFVGWWALGGITLLAVGYGVWEWRQEILAGIRKIGAFFTSAK